LLDHKSEGLVGSFNKLEHFVNTSGKKGHDTLLKLIDKEKTDVI
jgi:hypothetical protein